MATITILLDRACSGGEHVVLDVNVDGLQLNDVPVNSTELMTPLTVDDAPTMATALLRVHFKGKTRQQARTELLAGITLTV